jgi:hypothetical protein
MTAEASVSSPDEVLKSLPAPPKNLIGKDGLVVKTLVDTWVAECSGKCVIAQLTQDQINGVFLGWLKRARSSNYVDLVINSLVKKLIRPPRPKRSAEVSEETKARKVINAAAQLRGQLAVITGSKIVEAGEDAGNTALSLMATWKSRGQKPRSVIGEIMEDIQHKLLISDNAATASGNGQAADENHVLD